MKNKVAILTQPLNNNYGGLLQAFALRTVLQRMGYNAIVINRHAKNNLRWSKIISICKSLVVRYLFRDKNREIFAFSPSDKEKQIIGKNTDRFTAKYIQPTDKMYTSKELRSFSKKGLSAFIVGSDQVWRPCYSPNLPNYFLDFLGENKHVKRIAYAASFGTADCEYTPEMQKRCGELLSQFDAVSIREDSGISLCQNLFSIKAMQVLDPTLLLERAVYEDLTINEKEPFLTKGVFTYILDENIEKSNIIREVCEALRLPSFKVMPDAKFSKEVRSNIEMCIYPRVTSWLRAFIDAEYVVTDSFHGCAFSLIFNKPFIAIGNKDRGLSRFTSLLNSFGLKDRLIFDVNDLTSDFIHYSFDWNSINKQRNAYQEQSIQFLKTNL